MKNNYISVAIKNSTIQKTNIALDSLKLEEFILNGMGNSKITLDVEDLTMEYLAMSKFLKDNELEDENSFFNDFNMDPYGLKVDFEVNRDFKYMDILEPIVFILGQKLSIILETECVVMFANDTIPVALFNNGALIEAFEKYNLEFFKNKIWKPGSPPSRAKDA